MIATKPTTVAMAIVVTWFEAENKQTTISLGCTSVWRQRTKPTTYSAWKWKCHHAGIRLLLTTNVVVGSLSVPECDKIIVSLSKPVFSCWPQHLHLCFSQNRKADSDKEYPWGKSFVCKRKGFCKPHSPDHTNTSREHSTMYQQLKYVRVCDLY